MHKRSLVLILALCLVLSSSFALAAEGSEAIDWTSPVVYVQLTIVWVILVTLAMLFFKGAAEHHKKTFFWIIALPVALSTLYLGGHTVNENIHSLTKGPIHWHADYQVWVCDEQLDLIDPVFPRNKVGSPLFHEHNDDRIHVEGTVHAYEDVNVGAFFKIVGGEITATSLTYPTVDGEVSVRNGNQCPNRGDGTLKVYVNGQKIDDPANYMYFEHPLVPPGDCIIVEFGAGDADTTDKICTSWAALDWNYENFEQLREES